MKTSVIRQRVADFLKQHAPFDVLPEEDLLELAGSGKVKFHESEEYVFRQGETAGPFLWMIQQGRVEVIDESGAQEQLRDVLGAGDLAGLERFGAGGVLPYAARTASDTILYGVAADLFEVAMARYPAVRRFVEAHTSVAGSWGSPRKSWLEAEAPSLDFLKVRLRIAPQNATPVEMAEMALRSPSGFVAQMSGGRVTATGARELLSGSRGVDVPEMAAPATTREAVRTLLGTGAETLAVMEQSELAGILTSAELAIFCGYDVARIVGEIRKAATVEEMTALLAQAARMVRNAVAQPDDVGDGAAIQTALTAALAEAAVRRAAIAAESAGIPAPRAPYGWVLFDAAARGDLLENALPVLAAIYAGAGTDPEAVRYFTTVAGGAAAWLHRCGVSGAGADWPVGAQPAMPLAEWKRFYSETIRNPIGHDLYARRAFFDLAPLEGDTAVLDSLREHVASELRECSVTIPLLANDTLANLPPLTFFQGMVLELDGAQRASFDIAETVTIPIASAARVLALARGRLAPAGTLARLAMAADDEPEHTAIFREAAAAFRIGLYFQARNGGPRIEPGHLEKHDQLLLKTAFSAIQRFLEFTVSRFVTGAV